MATFLVLTTDLPFFPGKNGHDFFNLRELARTNHVGIVAPRYEKYPAEGVGNLVRAVQNTYLWPDPVPPVPLFVSAQAEGRSPGWLLALPAWFRRRILYGRLGLAGQPPDAYERVAIMANCAPYLLRALQERHWQAIILIQTSMVPWLEFLPEVGAKVVYFHDVRSDYLSRSTDPRVAASARKVRHQEQIACDRSDAVGFVSDLDQQRASQLLRLPDAHRVAPIPIDTDYFVPRPATWTKDPRLLVLFTGHLRHPPNVDAVLHFLDTFWPLIRVAAPDAIFQVVGLDPDERLVAAIDAAPNVELHPNVPDIRPYFWNANVYVVPMRFGGGVRQKIFEAWSMQLPVVSTTMGMEGTGAVDGTHCFLHDTPEGFANQVAKLLAANQETSVIQRASEKVHAHNSIPAAAGAFEQLGRLGIARRCRRPFKMLYDLRWMEIGKAGGVEQMTHELIHAISQLDRTNHYRLYVPRRTYHEWNLNPTFSCRAHFSDEGASRLETLNAMLTNRLAESVGLSPVLNNPMRTLRAWKKMDFDLVHATIGYLHPDLEAFPHVITVHDLQHLVYPQFFSREEWLVREHHYRESAKRATHLVAISEFTRQDIHRQYGIPLDKITTIWNIPSRSVWIPLTEETRRALLGQMGIDGPFLFFPAHCWPHKNHARLVEAFDLILPHVPKNLNLVLSGRPFPADHPAQALIERKQLGSRVIHLGYRSPLEMRALFQSCLLLAFPSLFEGFGMPVAEAIIAGKPVVCSGTTSLPEIAGDAALMFDPDNIHEIGGRLLEVINDSARREALTRAALQRRSLFSARLSAVKTISLYQRVHQALSQA